MLSAPSTIDHDTYCRYEYDILIIMSDVGIRLWKAKAFYQLYPTPLLCERDNFEFMALNLNKVGKVVNITMEDTKTILVLKFF